MSADKGNYYNNGILEMYKKDKFIYLKSLLSEEDVQKSVIKAKEILPKIKEELQTKINELIDFLTKTNPLTLLIQMAQQELFFNFNIFSESEMDKESIYLGYSITYLQSIMAANADFDYTKDLNEQQLNYAIKLMQDILQLYHDNYIGIKYIAQNNNPQNRDTLQLKMYLELLNNVTGNRYQIFHKSYFDSILLEQNDLIFEKYGVTADRVIESMESYNKFLSTGLNDAIHIMNKAFEDFQKFGYKDPINFRETMNNSDEISNANNIMLGDGLFDFGNISKLPPKLLDDLSFNPGDAKEFSDTPNPYFPDKVLPINIKPLIKINNNYYCFWSRTLYDKFYRTLYKALTNKDALKKEAWNNNQKIATEKNIPKIVCEQLGFSKCFTNNYYYIDEGAIKKKIENDAIIIYENKILIIEIKAGAISNCSISQDFQSFENNFNDIFNKGITQGERLIELLTTNDVNIYDENGNLKLKISQNKSENIFVLNITIDDMNEITAHFENTKYATYSKTHNCICLSLSDLLVYLDYFEDKISFFHFLTKRCKSLLTEKIKLNDELDHLGLYISHNDYTMYSSGFNANKIDWAGYRSQIDKYYCQKYNKTNLTKPIQNLPKRICEIIEYLNTNAIKYNNSIDIACKWLDLSFNAKEDLNEQINILIKNQDKILYLKGDDLNYSFLVKNENSNIDDKTIDDHIYATMLPTQEELRILFVLKYSSNVLVDLKYKEYKLNDIAPNKKIDCEIIKDIIIGKRIVKMKVRRNDLCPCGSGKKYKKCCLINYN